MVIDTSAIFAAIGKERDGALYRSAIKNAPLRLLSAMTLLEARVVLVSRCGSDAIVALDQLVEQARIVVVPFDEPLASAAFEAFQRYGKGRGHPAQLNILDCVVYALATSQNVPLLFKGNDFARTDVVSALDRPGL